MTRLQSNEYVDRFIESLEKSASAKIMRMLPILEERGSMMGMPYSKKIESHIFELRIYGEQSIRIFYTFHQNRIILLHGYKKKSEKTPFHELITARKRRSALT